jgi:DNA/RNA-binding domain of Phe-tRNA-synthetase-like protein
MHLEIGSKNPYLKTGFIHASNCITDLSSPGLRELINQTLGIIRSNEYIKGFDTARKLVRDMLRWGGFKPTGRNKPASEYIINNAVENRFPFILNAVDLNNLISLKYFLPVSTVDASVTSGDFILKEGSEGQDYIFNPSGQLIDLEGLITVFDRDIPIANPVKDSQKTKISKDTTDIAIFVYSSLLLYNEDQFSDIISIYCRLITKYLEGNINSLRIY